MVILCMIALVGFVIIGCLLEHRFDFLQQGLDLTNPSNQTPRLRGFEVVSDSFRKHPEVTIQLPRRADVGSCGYDFYSPIDFVLKPGDYLLIPTDIKAYMQQNEVLELNVRSNQGKLAIEVADTISWIDASYYNNPTNDGNIHIFLRNNGEGDYVVKQGDRVFQGKFSTYLLADEDDPLQLSRQGGLGSSGK